MPRLRVVAQESRLRRAATADPDLKVRDRAGSAWPEAQRLEDVQRINSLLPVVIRDSAAICSDAVRLTKLGAYYVFGGRVEVADVVQVLREAIAAPGAAGAPG